MKLLKHFLLLNLAVMGALLLTIQGEPLTTTEQEAGSGEEHAQYVSRFLLAQKKSSSSTTLAVMAAAAGRRKTCDKFPAICNARGSPGPHCCNKKCVDVLRDRFNCGKCGKNCRYNQICCHGKCVNPSFNRSHCGGCGNKCSSAGHFGKRGFCAFGLCNYA